jgi:hypothetical protein
MDMRQLIACTLLFLSADLVAQTHFPAECNDELQIRSAWPKHPDTLRFWVKGSATYRDITVQDGSGRTLVTPFRVDPPYFTYVFEVPRIIGELVVTSVGNGSPLDEHLMITEDLQRMPRPGEGFAIMAYGCLEPFEVDRDSSVVTNDGAVDGYSMLRAFLSVSSTHTLHTLSERRSETRAGVWQPWQLRNAPISNRPVAAIATGDQVYVDAGYEVDPVKMLPTPHPLSAWECKAQPMPLPGFLNDTLAYTKHMDNMYRAAGSFPDLNSALVQLPGLNVWDDHEIRDGWGSQGDEYLNDRMNPDLAPFFRIAQDACVAHQMALGPDIGSRHHARQAMDREFRIGHIRGFAFDLRTDRNYERTSINRVIGEAQWDRFLRWTKDLDQGDTIILISSIPLFYYGRTIERVQAKPGKELRDDILDSWQSDNNRPQRDSLVQMLIRLREYKDVHPIIISGDVHRTAISEIWYNDSTLFNWNDSTTFHKKRVLCYELTTTGLFHAHLKEHKLKEWFSYTFLSKNEAVREGSSFINLSVDRHVYTVDPHVKWSRVRQNFGFLDFAPDRAEMCAVYGDRFKQKFEIGDSVSMKAPFDMVVIRHRLDWDRSFAHEWSLTTITRQQARLRQYGWRPYTPSLPEQMSFFLVGEKDK